MDGDSAKLDALVGLWHAKGSSDCLPSRAGFSPEILWPWLGNISIFDVEHPFRIRIRLHGTEIVEYDGCDYTGRYLDEVLRPELRTDVLEHFRRCIRSRQPVRIDCQGKMGKGVELALRKVLLPISTDGKQVDQVISCLYARFPYRGEHWPGLQEATLALGAGDA
ncbi:MAG TPA: PAS domain-containing protein [Azospirillaceae bacterium]|nr:PAS domain-containing protein [Azospirillaceae bacterium]